MKNTFALSTMLAALFTQVPLYASHPLEEEAPSPLSFMRVARTNDNPLELDPSLNSLPNNIFPAEIEQQDLNLLVKALQDSIILENVIKHLYREDPERVLNFASMIKTLNQHPLTTCSELAEYLSQNKGKPLRALLKDRKSKLAKFFEENNLNYTAFIDFLQTLEVTQSQGLFKNLQTYSHNFAHSAVDFLLPQGMAHAVHSFVHPTQAGATTEALIETHSSATYDKLIEKLGSIPLMGGRIQGLAEKIEEVIKDRLGEKGAGLASIIGTKIFELISNTLAKQNEKLQEASTPLIKAPGSTAESSKSSKKKEDQADKESKKHKEKAQRSKGVKK